MKLIVGLGNPGQQYIYTRHNLGFLALAAVAQNCKVDFRKAGDALAAKANIEGVESSLLLPMSFMNNSGVAVKQMAAKKGIAPSDILVVCDDLTLPFGQMRVRPSGSAGGHNGLKSIIEHLGTNEFARLRLGIGSPKSPDDIVEYVLQNFTSGEKKALPDFINSTLLCIYCWVNQGVGSAMNQFNKRNNNE